MTAISVGSWALCPWADENKKSGRGEAAPGINTHTAT